MSGSTLLLTALLIGAVALVHSRPVENVDDAMRYLGDFGYLNGTSDGGTSMTDEKTVQAIRNFQYMANLTQTGELNAETYERMNMPRCGMPDNLGHNMDAKRKKRYALGPTKWSKRDLTYRIDNVTPDISEGVARKTLADALEIWADVTPLTFTEVRDRPADIVISFAPRAHGDRDAFDGPRGVLAHAYFPENGDAHFDEDENWTVESNAGIDLFQVAAHEFGHSLGLAHSEVQGALMFAYYGGYIPNFKLHSDDVAAIQAHYGVRSGGSDVTMAPNPPPGPGESDVLCTGKLDAVTTTRDGSTYMFEGRNVWKFEEYQDRIAAGFPKRIASTFRGVPANLDAALYDPENGKTYFFKGSQYWQFDNEVADTNYPRDIGDNWRGLPDDIDAAFVWSGNNNIYFVKGTQYYRFNSAVDPGYPRPLSVWNIPGNQVSAAVQATNQRTYFFDSNGGFYRFADRNFAVARGYPRSVAPAWQGCTRNIEGVTDAPVTGDSGVSGLVPSLVTLMVSMVLVAVH